MSKMSNKRNVLIFPAGSEIGMEIYHSLKYSHHVEVYGASGKSDHASFMYEEGRYVEDGALYVDRPDFIERLNGHLKRLDIEFVYPTHDTISNFLAKHQAQIAAKVITSCAETNRVARFKSETYRLFRGCSFCPEVFAAPYHDLPFPVFVKPDDGQGGKASFRADDEQDLEFYLRKSPDLLVSEYLPGEELSVDCFTDFRGELKFIGPRTRERVQMGISFRSTAVELTDEIRGVAQAINKAVSLNGAWFFQVKQDRHGRYKLLEFAPRQSSTMGLYRHTGVNFALLGLFNAQEIPVQIMQNKYTIQLDRCLHNRFKAGLTYRRVYVDFDETVAAGDHVHERVMAYLYQCRNRGVELVLLTKHRYDIRETLSRLAISPGLFKEILHLEEGQEKWAFIDPEGAIFIDNYWYDRREVSRRFGMPVFDVDAVECLLR
jgi:hypothetical protein